MLMKRIALATALVAGLAAPSAHALNAEGRLQLAGEFIGAHARIFAVGKRCNYTVEQLYGPEIALKQMAPLLSTEEYATLDAYLASPDFTQSVAVIEDDIKTSWNTLTTAQGKSPSAACATLIERAIAKHRDVNARLKDLH